MTRRSVALAVLATVCAPACLHAQTGWRFWSVADGLPESSTGSVGMDEGGVLWARHGVAALTRFDGYNITFTPDILGGGHMETAQDGSVWVRRGNNIRRYNGKRWTSIDLPDLGGATVKARSSADVNSFVPLPHGRLLVLRGDKVVELELNSKSIRVVLRAADTHLKSFTAMQRGDATTTWIAGERGLARISFTAAGEVESHDFSAPSDIADLGDLSVNESGEVLATATSHGASALVRFHAGAWSVLYASHSGLVRGWRGADADIWVADGNQVLRLAYAGDEKMPRVQALAGIVQGALQDSHGVFWLGTSQGIARYAPPLWRTDPELRYAELDDHVNAISEDGKGNVWFLSSRYLIRFDGANWQRTALPPHFKPDPGVTAALAVLPGDNIAVATSLTYILVFHPGSGTFERIAHPHGKTIRMFGRRANGELLVETLNGTDTHGFNIEFFDGHAFSQWIDLSRGPEFWDVRALCESTAGDLWIGAADGIGVYRNGAFHRVGAQDGLNADGIFSIREVAQGRLLFGGRKELYELHSGKWHVLATDLDRARAIASAPDGTLWIASGSGVRRFARGAWITNDMEDGLPSAVAYNILVDSKHRVWAATTRGISQYHPEADADPPQTILRDEFNTHQVAPGERTRIVFTGVDKWKFTETGRLLYSWRLDGGSWSPFSTAAAAAYSRMKPGSHRFEVRAMDRNGNIDPGGALFDFTVIPPWYLQPAFLFLATAGMLLIAYLLRSAWKHHRRVAFDSLHDPLTGLPNRRAFDTALHTAIEGAREDHSSIALMIVDLDRFKPINDTYGHAMGDLFLQEVASRMRNCMGMNDLLARVGGDEFAILVRDANAAARSESLCGRVQESLGRTCRVGRHELISSASIGIGLFPHHASDAETLQELADRAMYYCKANAKGSYSVFEPFMQGSDLTISRMAGRVAATPAEDRPGPQRDSQIASEHAETPCQPFR